MQTIRLARGGRTLGMAKWHASEDGDGAVQILEMAIRPAHRRKGHGGRLLAEVLAQASAYWRARHRRLRHVWTVAHQKRHMHYRAFLMRHGFHQVGIVPDLLRREDALVYAKGTV